MEGGVSFGMKLAIVASSFSNTLVGEKRKRKAQPKTPCLFGRNSGPTTNYTMKSSFAWFQARIEAMLRCLEKANYNTLC
ncbi:hypothetical protein IF1G_10552 [Cordyceps javanica]|uniref:Uncharacterized protein n=1 Tax=Cordyceps javanica TaxID=43265 RepID=A0A545UMW9_9HYPO|nr:hypothetical protein IF1G_10552 [Cordyceps javanica]